ncbi:MAG TPA: carboxypeptidase regulatory-like domain-containing protein, partial [Thermoanaerobaculia bacterium]|nr:carboxypeptidase regulatory-like domain-containing protein [Thermoanaerobaculia bacterium]
MRSRIAAILFGLFASPLFATITGTVMTSDGQPIAGAKVTISAIEPSDARRERLLTRADRTMLASTQSDAKGVFRFESPKEAVVHLRVEAKGYAPTGQFVERDGEINAIPLRKADTKTGTITANGKPVAGAVVIWSGATDTFATTDAEGHYSVADPAKWASRLTIVHPDFAIVDERVQGANDAMRRNVDRTLNAGTKLTGRVIGADGQSPAPKATVLVDGWPLAITADDGTFTIAHAPKKTETLAARSGSLYATRATPGANPTLRLAKPASLTGTLRDAKTRAAIAGAILRLGRAMRFDNSEIGTAVTDAKGNYSFLPVPAGSYQLFVTHPSYALPPVSVSVSAGQNVTRSFSASPLARISGTVIDEEKRAIAAASLRQDQDPMTRGPMMMRAMTAAEPVWSGPDGRFIFRTDDENVDLKARK